eukprot:SAG11_NODE_29513_length_310_cov_0.710900_1_plen_37_part_10
MRACHDIDERITSCSPNLDQVRREWREELDIIVSLHH